MYSTPIYRGKEGKSVKKITLYLHSFLSFYSFCKECNLGWTDKELHSYTIINITKLTHLILVSVGAKASTENESNMFAEFEVCVNDQTHPD